MWLYNCYSHLQIVLHELSSKVLLDMNKCGSFPCHLVLSLPFLFIPVSSFRIYFPGESKHADHDDT